MSGALAILEIFVMALHAYLEHRSRFRHNTPNR
ncbi:hypothetical protein MNBD_ALPHA05-1690 [hydrothermal vent metagenome]|uniref:Uncharacterized protein n=1 Tax=hydrothermal vent metagenome TaxID=652676 RepID=A0A3B0SFQ4_9ZZZZ